MNNVAKKYVLEKVNYFDTPTYFALSALLLYSLYSHKIRFVSLKVDGP